MQFTLELLGNSDSGRNVCNRVFAKQNAVLQISLIRQNNNYHKRENANGVKMTILQMAKYAN